VFVSEIINLDAFVNAYYSEEFLLYWGIFLLGGLFYGLTMWFYFNWQYRKIRAEHAAAQEDEKDPPVQQ
jgi:cbb3-type cytochrome oxidase subunit 3